MSMAAPSIRERRVVAIVAGAIAVLHVVWLHHVRFDDAYITFRYGANLARGQGLVFNVGDRIMGSTSPGECLLAALAYLVAGRDRLLGVMASLGCIAWVAEGAVLFVLLRASLGRLGAAAIGLAAALGIANGAPWVALETHVAAAFALLALHLAITRRPFAAPLAAAAATMMRPDAALLMAPLFALAIVDLRRAAWKPAALYVALLLPWVLFATAYFGTPLPQSAVRKFAQTDLLTYAEHAATLLAFPLGMAEGWRLLAIAMWGLAVAGGVALVKREKRLAALVAYPAIHLAAYLVLRPDVAFAWHLYPATLGFSVLVMAALVSFEGAVRTPGRIVAFTFVAYAAFECGRFAILDSHRGPFGGRDGVYRAIAKYLRAHARPTDRIGCEEVGTIGYLTDLPMNDNAGLTTRDPMAIYLDFLAKRPTDLRFMILGKGDLENTAPFYAGRTLTPVDIGGYVRFIVDLEETPRSAPASPPTPSSPQP